VTRGREYSEQDDADTFDWAVKSGIARLPAFWRGHGDHRSWSPIHEEHERCQLDRAHLVSNAVVVLKAPSKVPDVRGESVGFDARRRRIVGGDNVTCRIGVSRVGFGGRTAAAMLSLWLRWHNNSGV